MRDNAEPASPAKLFPSFIVALKYPTTVGMFLLLVFFCAWLWFKPAALLAQIQEDRKELILIFTAELEKRDRTIDRLVAALDKLGERVDVTLDKIGDRVDRNSDTVRGRIFTTPKKKEDEAKKAAEVPKAKQ